MQMTLGLLAQKVQKAVPSARCGILESQNQIIVTFENRPDTEIALLTPYQQMQIRKGHMDEDDYTKLLFCLMELSSNCSASQH